jgi:hypothetical protein
VIIPAEDDGKSSSSSSSSSSSDSSKKSVEKAIPETEIDVKEVSWKAVHRFDGPSFEAEETTKICDRESMTVEHKTKDYRQSGRAYHNQQIRITVLQPPVKEVKI